VTLPIVKHHTTNSLNVASAARQQIGACVVVPVYREQLEPFEQVSLTQLAEKLGKHPIEFVAPAGLDLRPYRRFLGERRVHRFDPRFFAARADSRNSYSALMVSEAFYGRFEGRYEHLLIHQTDAFVFEDQLRLWVSRDLDFVGSPHWAGWGANKELGMIGVGNGGFSLRRVDAFMRVLRDRTRLRNRMQLAVRGSHARALRRARKGEMVEDYYWGHFAPIRVASIREAIPFAFEMGLELMEEDYREIVPFGCHAVWNINFIANYRRGCPENRDPPYEQVLYRILERSGNSQECSETPKR
jgi:Protein of unknown function (DUF5672)